MAELPRRRRLPGGYRTWHALAAWEAAKGCFALVAVITAAVGVWQWPANALLAATSMNHAARTPWHLLLWGVAGYAALRFVEAGGLWRGRSWARWLSIAGNAAYIPLELWELAHGANWWMGAVLAMNVVAVAMVLAMQPAPSELRRLVRT
jgi:uncharacterized membrane protein (DUF2068 family)